MCNLWNAFVSIADRHAPVVQKCVCGIDNCPWLDSNISSTGLQRSGKSQGKTIIFQGQ